jgi:hypothetical protein
MFFWKLSCAGVVVLGAMQMKILQERGEDVVGESITTLDFTREFSKESEANENLNGSKTPSRATWDPSFPSFFTTIGIAFSSLITVGLLLRQHVLDGEASLVC